MIDMGIVIPMKSSPIWGGSTRTNKFGIDSFHGRGSTTQPDLHLSDVPARGNPPLPSVWKYRIFFLLQRSLHTLPEKHISGLAAPLSANHVTPPPRSIFHVLHELASTETTDYREERKTEE